MPWGDEPTFSAHAARYEFARPYARGREVLEVGSGEGYGAELLAEVAECVMAVDYALVAVDHARQKYLRPNLTFQVAEAENLPFPDEAFDLVVAFEILEHTMDHERVVGELGRVLRPGGRLLVSTPNGKLERMFEQVARRDHYEYHVNTPSARELRSVLTTHLGKVTLYGQSEWRSSWHTFFKAIDVFDLRHRVVRSAIAQRMLLQRFFPSRVSDRRADKGGVSGVQARYRFSRLLAYRSPMILGVGVKSRLGPEPDET